MRELNLHPAAPVHLRTVLLSQLHHHHLLTTAPTSRQSSELSTVTLGEYAEVDVRGHVCQYQHLDLSQLEDHVDHSLCGPKDGPMQMNC